MSYSRLKEVTIQNFMSIEQAIVEFDDQGILVIKGFNDSGKSAVLKAIRVLLEDWNKTKQKKYIKDGTDYFRITATFDDGVKLLRDKYKNGQSLYEMYKDGNLVYTNKSGKTIVTVKEMPPIIAEYINIPSYGNRVVNSQSCSEPYLLVETKGSENYTMLCEASDDGTLLRSIKRVKEELKENQLDLNHVEEKIGICEGVINSLNVVDDDVIDALKGLNEESKNTDAQKLVVASIIDLVKDLDAMDVPPQITEIHGIEQRLELEEIQDLIKKASVTIQPQIDPISDTTRLADIQSILSAVNKIESTTVPPHMENITTAERLDDLNTIMSLIDNYSARDGSLRNKQIELKAFLEQAEKLTVECVNLGVKVVDCPKCGYSHVIDLHKD